MLRTKTQWVLLLAVVAFLLSIPSFASAYWLTQLTLICITVIVVLGLHILCGLCGLISIGQAGLMAVGAYTAAILTTRYDIDGWICLPFSALAAGLVGVLVGLPSFRLKLFYLAISTLAAQEIILWILKYRDFWDVTGGFTGLQMEPLTLGSISFGDDGNLYILGVILAIIAAFITVNIQRSNTGRIFVAIRDNELAAEVAGISLFRNKLLAFFIAAAFAGVAGWLWAYSQLRVNPSQFNFGDSIFYMGMIIIGGLGNISGVFLGAFMLEFMGILNSDYLAPYAVDNLPTRYGATILVAMRYILGGAGVIMFLIFVPRGMSGQLADFKNFYRLWPYSFRGS